MTLDYRTWKNLNICIIFTDHKYLLDINVLLTIKILITTDQTLAKTIARIIKID